MFRLIFLFFCLNIMLPTILSFEVSSNVNLKNLVGTYYVAGGYRKDVSNKDLYSGKCYKCQISYKEKQDLIVMNLQFLAPVSNKPVTSMSVYTPEPGNPGILKDKMEYLYQPTSYAGENDLLIKELEIPGYNYILMKRDQSAIFILSDKPFQSDSFFIFFAIFGSLGIDPVNYIPFNNDEC